MVYDITLTSVAYSRLISNLQYRPMCVKVRVFANDLVSVWYGFFCLMAYQLK